MNLLAKHNGHADSEYIMQDEVESVVKEINFGEYWKPKYPDVFREVRIPEIGRISDIIVKVSDRKMFNIECKISDVAGVMRQAKDHLKWADYSYICIHDRAYIPVRDIKEMTRLGIGLLIWKRGVLTEAFGSPKNKNIDKKIRKVVVDRLTAL